MEPPERETNNDEGAAEPENGRPSKRMKRGKYVLRACMHCQRRKIKCEGGTPCSQCIARKRDCISGVRAPAPVRRGRPLAPGESIASILSRDLEKDISPAELLHRLINVEQRISAVMDEHHAEAYEDSEHASDTGNSESQSPGPASPTDHRQVYFGEGCIDEAMEHASAELAGSRRSSNRDGHHNGGSLTPKPQRGLNASNERRSKSWLRTLLFSYGINPREDQWREYLQTYFDEVHILYPLLHPQTIWRSFDWMWSRQLLLSADELASAQESKVSLAIVFLCLATGRCTVSPRTDDIEGRHSAGWSLYSVATYLLRDLLDLARFGHTTNLVEIQALAQLVGDPTTRVSCHLTFVAGYLSL